MFFFLEKNAVLDLVHLKSLWKFENEILLQACKKKCIILIVINYIK